MKHILVVSQYFYPETFRINDIASEWVKRGYKVTVLTGIPNYPQGEYYDGYSKTDRTREDWNGVEIIRLPIEPRKTGAKALVRNYLSFVKQGRKWVKKTDVKADVVFTFEVSPTAANAVSPVATIIVNTIARVVTRANIFFIVFMFFLPFLPLRALIYDLSVA